MEINVSVYFILFIIYAMIGWCIEIINGLIQTKKFVNRGFLIGPYCPIYGVGGILITLLLSKYYNDPIVLFFMGIAVCGILEYLTSYIMEKIFKARWWDYSKRKFNINGRICLETIIPFGLLGCFIIYISNPFFINLINKMNKNTINIIAIVLLADLIVTIIKVKNIKMTLKKVEEINKEIKAKLNEIRKLTKENNKSEEKTIKTENVQKLVRKLKRKRDRMTLSLYKNVYRLKKAFPAINTKEITEILNKKIQIRKNKKNT